MAVADRLDPARISVRAEFVALEFFNEVEARLIDLRHQAVRSNRSSTRSMGAWGSRFLSAFKLATSAS